MGDTFLKILMTRELLCCSHADVLPFLVSSYKQSPEAAMNHVT